MSHMPSATPSPAAIPSADDDPSRRPRLAIMGEFSAGKSTLTNLLLGCDALPTKVTATQLPPVWISHGDAAPQRLDIDGTTDPIDFADLDAIDLTRTQHISVQHQADILEHCDLIDFPGISDPNMSADVWQRALPLVDAVLWCTHATQAWRQSEAAVWDDLPEDIRPFSLLLLTRIDKVTNAQDRGRVIARVTHEAGDLFAGIYPVSLTQAQSAAEGSEQWAQSGAGDMLHAIRATVQLLSGRGLSAGRPIPKSRPIALAEQPMERAPESAVVASIAAPPQDGAGRVVPRRVRPRPGTTRQRPAAAQPEL